MRLIAFLSVFVLLVRAEEDQPQTFRNFKLIRINPESDDSLKYLQTLYEGTSPYDLDFWQPPTHIGGIVDVAVGPADAPIFVKDLASKKLNYVVAVNDLQQAIANERSPKAFYHPETGGYAYDKYNSLEDIHDELKRLKKDKPDMVTLIDIGQSVENRTLLVIKLSGKRKVAEGIKASMWIDAGIHAREWIAPATAMYILHELVHGYESDPTIQNLLDHMDFYILPVMNPDGYEYSRTKNRMWRKNRRPATCKRQHFHTLCCAGVDLNRNFDWFFGSVGASNDPCHETYHGPSAFSEPESIAVKEFLEANKPEAFISLHSYSQMWLIPFGHRKRSYPQDYHTALRPLALRATKALSDIYGTKYQVGTGADLMYEAAGGSHDWAKGSLKVPYAYLIELRPKNTLMGHGFLLPEREIATTGLETFESLKVVADELIGQFVQPKLRKIVGSTTVDPLPTPGPETRGPFYRIVHTTPKTHSETTQEANTTSSAEPTTTSATTPEGTTPSATEPSTTRQPSSTEVVTTTNKAHGKEDEEENRSRPEIDPPIDGVSCQDYGSYCRLWAVLMLCDRPSVQRLCAKTCHPECAF